MSMAELRNTWNFSEILELLMKLGMILATVAFLYQNTEVSAQMKEKGKKKLTLSQLSSMDG
jgi:hypothetical protein